MAEPFGSESDTLGDKPQLGVFSSQFTLHHGITI